MKFTLVLLGALLLGPVPVVGQDTPLFSSSLPAIWELRELDLGGLQELAEQGYVFAQEELGRRYAIGQGVPQNQIVAMRWTRRAAEQGLVAAQFVLAMSYRFGWGVPQDFERAHMWYNLGATQGDEVAQEVRDYLATEMTSQQIEQAQAMATRCLESNYSDCD